MSEEQTPHGPSPLLAAWALLGFTVARVAQMTVVDIDLFHSMALFREVLQTQAVPRTDSFAWTQTLPEVVHHELGTGALLWTVTSAGGAAGLMGLKYALVATLLGLIVLHVHRRSGSLPALVFALPIGVGFAQVGMTTIRAQFLTLVFLALLLVFLQLDREGSKRWIPGWIAMHTAWGTMHAGVVVGMGLLGFHWLDRVHAAWRQGASPVEIARRTGHLIALLALAPLLLCVGPYGPDYLPVLLHGITMKRPMIGEWHSLWSAGQPAMIAMWGLSVAIAAYALAVDKRRELFPVLALAVTALLSARTYRHLSMYGVVWLAFVPALLHGTEVDAALRKLWRERSRVLSLGLLLLGLLSWGNATRHRFWQLQIPADPSWEELGVPIYPVGAADWLEAEGWEGKLYTPFQTGAYVSWRLYPKVLVSFDSRYEAAYPPGALEENTVVYEALPTWQELASTANADAFLIPRRFALADQFGAELGDRYRRLYQDDVHAVWVRTDASAGLTPTDRRGERIEGRFP